jgi:hypothetical protein
MPRRQADRGLCGIGARARRRSRRSERLPAARREARGAVLGAPPPAPARRTAAAAALACTIHSLSCCSWTTVPSSAQRPMQPAATSSPCGGRTPDAKIRRRAVRPHSCGRVLVSSGLDRPSRAGTFAPLSILVFDFGSSHAPPRSADRASARSRLSEPACTRKQLSRWRLIIAIGTIALHHTLGQRTASVAPPVCPSPGCDARVGADGFRAPCLPL